MEQIFEHLAYKRRRFSATFLAVLSVSSFILGQALLNDYTQTNSQVAGAFTYGPLTQGETVQIQAENYDQVNGIGYLDFTKGNRGNAYRSDDVDIWEKSPGRYIVSAVQSGEWLRYTFRAPKSGVYDIEIAASGEGVNTIPMLLEIDGKVVNNVSVIAEGPDTFRDYTVPEVSIAAGQHQLRILAQDDGISLDTVMLERIR